MINVMNVSNVMYLLTLSNKRKIERTNVKNANIILKLKKETVSD